MLTALRCSLRPALSSSLSTTAKAAATAAGTETTLSSVQDYYGKVLQSTKDLKTSACTTSAAPPALVREAISLVPDEVISKYYGCGSPLPMGIDGLSVLDLGSGSGRDCYVASNLVGEHGKVVGVDMTDEQLTTARNNVDAYTKQLGYARPNLSFVTGYIEDLAAAGVAKNSVDLCISNCVINLSPDKPAVLQGVYDCLKEGGELHFSDVYADRRLPEHVRQHEVLWGECASLSGSDVGFADVRVLETSPIAINDPELKEIVGEANFYSITYRCFKLPQLETLCEDYGQVWWVKVGLHRIFGLMVIAPLTLAYLTVVHLLLVLLPQTLTVVLLRETCYQVGVAEHRCISCTAGTCAGIFILSYCFAFPICDTVKRVKARNLP